MKKFTKLFYFKNVLLGILFILSGSVYAQLGITLTSFSPKTVTQRTVVTLYGSGFTSSTTVSFGGVAAAGKTFISSTQMQAVVAAGSSSGSVTVSNGLLQAASEGGLVYLAPAATPATAAVNRVVTDWNGYWNSAAASTAAANQPDDQHNLLGFGYGGTVYSTGVNNMPLTTNNVTFTAGDFRALPISAIQGTTSTSASSNYLTMATKMDGNAAAANYQAASIANLTARDVLIDGIKGLGLGSGVTNINTNAVLTFTISNIQTAKISDSEPDIIITQVADPTANVDIYSFIDANGNIVGKALQANLSSVAAVGTYRQDLFTLPASTAYATATPSANGATGTKDIRIIAFKLSDFGIDATNYASAIRFKVMPGGDSDIAFIGYNAGAITIPAPVITVQPTSQVVCPGTNGSATFSVTATGAGLSYQWKKNGIDIAGATAATYTITNVQASDIATYTVVVTNTSGSVVSNSVYLNTIIAVQPVSVATCLNSGTSLSFTANGASLTYQWYSNTVNSNSGGALIPGATANTYSPPVNAAGTTYYYAVITNSGQGCAGATTNAVAVTVSPTPVAGTVSANQAVCSGSNTTITLTGYTGTIQWQQSANGTTGWANVTGGSGATSASYTTPALTSTTYYRARVTSGSCSVATSDVINITVNTPATAGTISGNQTICGGNTATLTVTGASGNIQWQQSAGGIDGWTNVTGGSGATTASYTTAALSETTYYRAVITSGACTEAISGTTTVTVIDNIWTGDVNTDWHIAGNWTCGIPTLVQNVVIPQRPNQPVVLAGLTALGKTLIIQDGAIVTVNAMNNIHVANTITVAATGNMVVNSTANLIQDMAVNTNTGKITVKRDSSPLYRQDYTLWSTPVTGQKLFQFSPVTLANRFYTYDPAIDLYSVVPGLSNASTTTFATGLAYLIRMPNSAAAAGYNAGTATIIHHGEFTGVPNNGIINVPVSTALNRYNGIGNPYPSAISIWDFIDANANSLEAGTLYFWRKKNNNSNPSYAAVTKFAYLENRAEGGSIGAGGFMAGIEVKWVINPGQGFLVKVKPGTTHLIFTNAMRRTMNSPHFFRMSNDSIDASKFRLNITSGAGEFGQAVIGYSNVTTNSFDYGWDGILLNDGSVAVYTAAEGNDLSIQARAEFNDADVVPVSYRVTNTGSYTFKLAQPDGIFAEPQNIYLKDRLANITHDLKSADYTFASEAGTFTDRFEILYTNSTLGITAPKTSTNNFIIFKQGNNIHVDGGSSIINVVKLFDTRGRLVSEITNINDSSAIISNVNSEQQVLLVQVITADGIVISKKVIF